MKWVLTVVLLGLAGAQAAPNPKAPAVDARVKYAAALKQAEREYGEALLNAKSELVKHLEKELTAATKAGDLDDALALRKEAQQLQEEIRELAKRPDDRAPIKVVSARYGAEDSWADLTEDVQKMVKDNRLAVPGQLWQRKDPLRNRDKQIVVECDIGGDRRILVSADENNFAAELLVIELK